MNVNRFRALSGLAGVAGNESARAHRWAARFEFLMAIVVFWIPIQWYLETQGAISLQASRWADWIVWTLFVTETSVLTLLVRYKAYYLRHNWMNLLIIIGGLPLAWNFTPLAGMLRALRLLLLVSLLFRFSHSLHEVLSRNRLGTTLAVSLAVIMLAGVLMAAIDPAVKTPMQGIWWAWVTVTTVGYGDIVPSTGAGRIFASLLILMGIALFALLTASFSSFFLERNISQVERDLEKDVSRVEHDLERDVSKVEQEEENILVTLRKVNRALERIEQRLEALEEQGTPSKVRKQR